MTQGVAILPFAPADAQAFKELNLNWIRAHWEPEPADFETLDHPLRLIDSGGHILIAKMGARAVGTCALIQMDSASYELAKMAVADDVRGHGIGRLLGEGVIAIARELGAERLYLESNTVLEPAIQLYRRLGFREITGQPSPYARCNIQMELGLID